MVYVKFFVYLLESIIFLPWMLNVNFLCFYLQACLG